MQVLEKRSALSDTSYVLTKSLYAQHKQVALGEEAKSHKLITALSISEIETRKSFALDEADAAGAQTPDEKQVKEEMVLIGEKSDIDSLVDNENNKLFNLIMANAKRGNAIEALESDLNRQRLNRVRSEPDSTEIEIEIEVEETACQQEQETPVAYEESLRDIAKSLVDEITKISVNKVKIDDLKETVDTKYFSSDLLTKNQILSSLVQDTCIQSEEAPNTSSEVNLLFMILYYSKRRESVGRVVGACSNRSTKMSNVEPVAYEDE